MALAKTMAEVSAGAPGLPFYYYHIPSRTGVTVKMEELLKAADTYFPGLTAIKFTDVDFLDFERCVRYRDGHYTMLYGHEEMTLSALPLGASASEESIRGTLLGICACRELRSGQHFLGVDAGCASDAFTFTPSALFFLRTSDFALCVTDAAK